MARRDAARNDINSIIVMFKQCDKCRSCRNVTANYATTDCNSEV